MAHSPQPTERFAQHSRLSELVTAPLVRAPAAAPPAITGAEVLGVVPRGHRRLLDTFHRLADHHQHG